MTQQQKLPLGDAARPSSWVDDFKVALPKGILPTRAGLLEGDGSILVIKEYEHGSGPSRGQRMLWKSMVQLGSHVDAPGSVTVYCVWGNTHTQRQLVVYDHMGVSEPVFLSSRELQDRYAAWWREHGGRR